MDQEKSKVHNGSSLKTSQDGPPPNDDISPKQDEGTRNIRKGGGFFLPSGNFIQSRFLRKNLLTLLTVLAVIVGIGLGFGLRKHKKWTKREVMYISFPGELFLRMLKGLILPLIVSSLVSALGSLDTKLSGRIGTRAIAYYFGTTILAIILGIILVVSIRPGVSDKPVEPIAASNRPPQLTVDTMLDLLRNMFPPNIVEACFAQHSTVLIPPKVKEKNGTNTTKPGNTTDETKIIYGPAIFNINASEANKTSEKEEVDHHGWDIGSKTGGGTNILGLVVFSVVLGVTLGRMENAGKPLLLMFTSLSDAMMTITRLVIWLSPVGVMFLIAGKIVEMADIAEVIAKVGMYTVTVLIGLFIHGLVVLPLLYFIFIHKLPFTYIGNMSQALATAFGTSSSSATLPVTISCLERKNNIDPRISRFCLPIGATINMDGTALYEAVAAIFIAQIREVPLTVGNIIGISITATAASIGAAGIPQAGLVTMVMVLNVVGLPADDVALILVVDWFLDRFRTTINVLGDAIGAAIVAHLSKDNLAELDKETLKRTAIEMTPL